MKSFKHYISESVNDKGILKAIFVIGIPGAGKSYTVKKLNGTIAPVMVNTDRAVEFLIKKKGIASNSETWKDHFEDSSLRITSASLYNYLNGMLPLFVDGTSNNLPKILHRFGILESIGYDLGVIHVDTPLETAIARAQQRSKDIGRDVNIDFIKAVHAETEENAEFLKSKAIFFKKINNAPQMLDDKAIQDAFKSTQGFFAAPVDSPIGKRHLKSLAASGEKYITPTIYSEAQLEKLVGGWYK